MTALHSWTAQELEANQCFFQSSIRDDPWVVYHGTSSWAEDRIDRDGLSWQSGLYTEADVESVCRIFRSMNWAGLRSGGLGVLETFTRGDFRGGAGKPGYFRPWSVSAVMYASRDFAGGETARALRYAFEDLRLFLSDPGIREQHKAEQRRVCEEQVAMGRAPRRVMEVHLSWLRDVLARLSSVEASASVPIAAHTHGVVYAVRLGPDILPHTQDAGIRGIEVGIPLPRNSVVAKIHVDDSACDRGFQIRAANDAARWIAFRTASPLSALIGRRTVVAPSPAERLARDNDVDPTAGADEALEIVERVGPGSREERMRPQPDRPT